jgi:hypothetical protein
MTESVADIMQRAAILVKSGMLPEHIKTPEAAFAIICLADEMQIPRMRAFMGMHIIKGKVELSSELMLEGFINRGGRVKWIDPEAATVQLTAANGDAVTMSFTAKDAATALLNGDNWKKYPGAMRRARAVSAGLRAIGEAHGYYAPGEIGGPEIVENTQEDERVNQTSVDAKVEESRPKEDNAGWPKGPVATLTEQAAVPPAAKVEMITMTTGELLHKTLSEKKRTLPAACLYIGIPEATPLMELTQAQAEQIINTLINPPPKTKGQKR